MAMSAEAHPDSATPGVTIVIAAFKPTFLDEAVRSVLEQDYPALELVALDDSGGADVMPILERHASREPERMTVARHPTVGQARTLNRGFGLARGDRAPSQSSPARSPRRRRRWRPMARMR
jgi:hypothetical protein